MWNGAKEVMPSVQFKKACCQDTSCRPHLSFVQRITSTQIHLMLLEKVICLVKLGEKDFL
jgi:hypothetical protein